MKEMIMLSGALGLRALRQGRTRTEVLEQITKGLLHGRIERQDLLAFGSVASFGIAWAESAFPTIDIGHKLASSLMCTTIPADLVKNDLMPWRCFAINVPEGLLENHPTYTTPEFILVLHSRAGGIKALSVSAGSFELDSENSLGGFCSLDAEETINTGPVYPDSLIRRARLLRRLIVGACLEISTKQNVTEVAKRTGCYTRKARSDPKTLVFRLTRDVLLDTRQSVKDYIATGDSSIAVQCLVRGHFKRQVHGIGKTDRKWIHIEPYWRGPEDAPIAVRNHVLRGDL